MAASKQNKTTKKTAVRSTTKSRVAGSNKLRKKSPWQNWMALPIVALAVVVGYVVVQYSQAANKYAWYEQDGVAKCYALHNKAYPNPTNISVCDRGDDGTSFQTGDLITYSEFPTYEGMGDNGYKYTNSDRICVTNRVVSPPRIPLEGSTTSQNSKSTGASEPQYAPTPSDTTSVALTLKSNGATRVVYTSLRYGPTRHSYGQACTFLVGESWDYSDAMNTPGGIQVKVLQGPVKDLKVYVSPGGTRPTFDLLDIFKQSR